MYIGSDLNAEDTDRLSRKARGLAEHHGTPLAPAVYEIWFSYVLAENPALIETVDALFAEHNQLTPDAISAIHRKFFAPAPLDNSVCEISTEMEQRLEDVAELCERNAHDFRSFPGVVGSCHGNFESTETGRIEFEFGTISPAACRQCNAMSLGCVE